MAIPTGVISNQHFQHQAVHVDDNTFFNCRFTECKIIFMGTGPVRFDRCVFDRCSWEFDGPAETTLLFLSALYRGLDAGGKHLVESMFESIRTGAIDQGILGVEPSPALMR